MKLLYFDCFSGISGDMTLGALLHLGIDLDEFKCRLERLGLDEYRLEVRKDERKGIEGLKVDVVVSHHNSHHHRHLKDIQEIIHSSDLSPFVKERSMNIFKTIAEAEGKIHGMSPGEVHFHEVGAVDSIVDVVGACICLEMMEVDKIISSPLNVGRGFVECAHGTFPVPAPATLEILKGVPVYSSGLEGELVTPTGAAIIKEFAGEFTYLPSMKAMAIGYGLGAADREVPNVLRVIFGEVDNKKREAWVLETNIDDMNPQFYVPVMDKLFSAGVYDVFLTPIIMKKGRPGIKLSVICGEEQVDKVNAIIMNETTTLGVRRYRTFRDILEREVATLDTQYGPVDVKIAKLPCGEVKFAPEYECLNRISRDRQIPLRELYQQVMIIIRDHLTKA